MILGALCLIIVSCGEDVSLDPLPGPPGESGGVVAGFVCAGGDCVQEATVRLDRRTSVISNNK